MKFGDFNKLACGDRVTLISAIDILMQVGQNYVRETQLSEIVSEMKKGSGKLFSGDMLEEIAKIVQELAQLRTCKLLAYVKRSSLDFRGPDAPRSGLCPICGCELDYDMPLALADGNHIDWTCQDCGATGKEGFQRVFTTHYDVCDGDGKPFPISND